MLNSQPDILKFQTLRSKFQIKNTQPKLIKHLASILSLIFLSLCSAYGQGSSTPYAEAELTSHQLIPGEQAHLTVRMRGGEPDARPAPPKVPNTAVNFIRSTTWINSQQKLSTAFLFRVTPAKAGSLTIPPIALRSRGITYHTQPLNITVHPLSKLTTLASGIENQNILVGWFPEKTTLYQGEQCPVTLKLYVPLQLPVATQGWGLPDPQKNNCLAWRFSPPQTNVTSQVTINGTSYQSFCFKTTLSGIQPGPATFGPAKLRIIVRQSVIDPLRGSRLVNIPVSLTVPALPFKILPLPGGAPKHFRGAVGQFSIEAHCKQPILDENEPTELLLSITGRGNLATLRPPVLSDESWKIIDSSKITRGKERRNIQGAVTFRQLLRPNKSSTSALPTAIPSYTLSYFNPKDQTYHTLSTNPIPVQVSPSPPDSDSTTTQRDSTTEKLGTRPEEMRNILGFINRPDTQSRGLSSLSHLWQIPPALIALCLLAIPLLKKIKLARAKHPNTIQKEQELAALATETDPIEFYRNAGRFIEQWLNKKNNLESEQEVPASQQNQDHAKELNHILATRDNLCFQTVKTQSDPIAPDVKKSILALLKRCSRATLPTILISMLLFLCSNTIQANDSQSLARDAWKSGEYQQAIELYQQAYPDPLNTPADILYNIGNCHFRLLQPGLAALAWRRALLINPSHKQARQNLSYLEREQASIVPSYADWQQQLTVTQPRTYQIIFYASLWIFALTLLALIILRPRGIKLTGCIILLIITPVTASLGALASHWYPDDHLFAPLETQAVALQHAILYKEAHRQEKSPRLLPPATLLKINAIRGPWTHVTTPDGKSGWISHKNFKKILLQ